MGICNLVKKHTAATIDAACQKALKAGAGRLKDIQRLIGEPSEAIKAGFLVLYRSVFDLVRELSLEATQAGESRLLGRYLKPDLLNSDPLGGCEAILGAVDSRLRYRAGQHLRISFL